MNIKKKIKDNKCKLCGYHARSKTGQKIHFTRKHEPKQDGLLNWYKEPTVTCLQCGLDIGKISKDNCPDCGFDVTESLTQWIMKNARFPVDKIGRK